MQLSVTEGTALDAGENKVMHKCDFLHSIVDVIIIGKVTNSKVVIAKLFRNSGRR